MASVTKLKAGRRAVQFTDAEGDRHMMRLGKMTKSEAQDICGHVEDLLSARRTGRLPRDETAAWLVKCGDELYTKLFKYGLVDARQATTATLAETLDAIMGRRVDWKPAQRRAMTTLRNRMVDHFGANTKVRSISVSDARDFRRRLKAGDPALSVKPLALATIAKMVKGARAFFADMVERRIIQANPFTKVEAGSQENMARLFYVPTETIDKLIAVCPTEEWKVILTLARYAGLRTPSEVLLLKWEDIHWHANRMRIHSPKTAGVGKAERWCPLWPQVRDALKRHRSGAAETDYIIELHRYTAHGFRVNLEKFITDAKVSKWPKLWQNMRSSAATDMIERNEPITLVAQWIGNTQHVLEKHYMQQRDAQFTSASQRASLAVGQWMPANAPTVLATPENGLVTAGPDVTLGKVGPLGREHRPRKLVKSTIVLPRASRRASRPDRRKQREDNRLMARVHREFGATRAKASG